MIAPGYCMTNGHLHPTTFCQSILRASSRDRTTGTQFGIQLKTASLSSFSAKASSVLEAPFSVSHSQHISGPHNSRAGPRIPEQFDNGKYMLKACRNTMKKVRLFAPSRVIILWHIMVTTNLYRVQWPEFNAFEMLFAVGNRATLRSLFDDITIASSPSLELSMLANLMKSQPVK